MFLVTEVLRRKGSQVITIAPTESAQAAAQSMNQHRIGSLVVTEGDAVVGIVTERDILTKVVAAERSPGQTPVSAIMTQRVLTCAPETTLDELRKTMRERRIRHVPVMEGGRL